MLAVPYYYYRVNTEIRRTVQTQFAEHYQDLDVRVRSAQLVEGEGIYIRGLSLSEKHAEGPLSELAFFDEIFLACRTDAHDLIRGDLGVTRIAIRRPTFRVTRRPDGSWSIAGLWPFPKFGNGSPVISIEGGVIEIFDPIKTPSSSYTVRDVNLAFIPEPKPEAAGDTKPPMRIEGSLRGDYIGKVELRGWQNPATQQWSLGGNLEHLDLSPEIREAMPEAVAESMAALGSLRGGVRLRFQINGDEAQGTPLQFDVAGHLSRGRFDDPRLPFPLSEIDGSFRATHKGITVETLSAQSGQAHLWASGSSQGYSADSPLSLEMKVDHLPLDRHLVDVLPDKWKQIWYKFLPAGEVNAHLTLSGQQGAWKPQLLVECTDTSFSFYKFPYRIERTSGSVNLVDDTVRVNLKGHSGSHEIHIDGAVQDPGPNHTFGMTIRSADLPIDAKLLAALPEKSRAIVESLGPRGSVNGSVRLDRKEPQGKIHRHLVLDLNRIDLRYDKFPYPLRQVQGRIEEVDERWSFRNLQAVNDTAIVHCFGHCVPSLDGHDLFLRFDASEVPLSEDLRMAMPESAQETWSALRPRGIVDFVSEVRYQSATNNLDVGVDVVMEGEGLTVIPEAFPLQLDEVKGKVLYRNGRADFQGLTARHGRMKVATDGFSEALPDGGWTLSFSNLVADRVRPDRDLLVALPADLRKAVTQLNPTSPINLQGSVEFGHSGQTKDSVTSRWDLDLTTLQSQIDCGVRLENVSGGVRLAGQYDANGFSSRGYLDLDSVTYNDFQFTEIRGPLWIDEEKVTLGAPEDQPARAANQVTAKFYGGTLFGHCVATLGPTTHFGLRADFRDGDLARFAKERIRGTQQLVGKVNGNIMLEGTSRGMHTLQGRGALRVDSGEIYELPLITSILGLLTLREDPSFARSEIDYRIQGDRVQFDRVNFYGNALSLMGKGEMDFNHRVNMVFHAVVGREDFQIPILKPILGLASQQLMLIYVDGPLSNPRTTRQALPGLKQAVDELQRDLETAGRPSVWDETRQRTQDVIDQINPLR